MATAKPFFGRIIAGCSTKGAHMKRIVWMMPATGLMLSAGTPPAHNQPPADPLPAIIHGHRLPPEPDPKVNSVGYKYITAFAGVMV